MRNRTARQTTRAPASLPTALAVQPVFSECMHGQGFIAATNMKPEGQPGSITDSRHTDGTHRSAIQLDLWRVIEMKTDRGSALRLEPF
jgi:hypothetical protein